MRRFRPWIFAQRGKRSDFFEPVHLDFELTDLLIELSDQRFLLGFTPVGLGSKERGQSLQHLLFPRRHLERVDAELGGDFVLGLHASQSFSGDFRLQVGAVRRRFSGISGVSSKGYFDTEILLPYLSNSTGEL